MIFRLNNLTISQLDLLKLCEDLKKVMNSFDDELMRLAGKEDCPLLFMPFLLEYSQYVKDFKEDLEKIGKRIKEVK